jgi:hypothetical protein
VNTEPPAIDESTESTEMCVESQVHDLAHQRLPSELIVIVVRRRAPPATGLR